MDKNQGSPPGGQVDPDVAYLSGFINRSIKKIQQSDGKLRLQQVLAKQGKARKQTYHNHKQKLDAFPRLDKKSSNYSTAIIVGPYSSHEVKQPSLFAGSTINTESMASLAMSSRHDLDHPAQSSAWSVAATIAAPTSNITHTSPLTGAPVYQSISYSQSQPALRPHSSPSQMFHKSRSSPQTLHQAEESPAAEEPDIDALFRDKELDRLNQILADIYSGGHSSPLAIKDQQRRAVSAGRTSIDSDSISAEVARLKVATKYDPQIIDRWTYDFDKEMASFDSIVLFIELRLRELLQQESRHGNKPTPLKAAVSADMLLRICAKMGRFSAALAPVIHELLNCMFVDYMEKIHIGDNSRAHFNDSNRMPSVNDFFKLDTFAEQLERTQELLQRSVDEQRHLQETLLEHEAHIAELKGQNGQLQTQVIILGEQLKEAISKQSQRIKLPDADSFLLNDD